MSDSDFFDDFDDDYDDDDEWDEEMWEQYFQQEDEQKRRLEELINKYGFTEQGLRLAFKELGYPIPDESDDEPDQQEQNDDEQNIDSLLEEQYGNWSPDLSSRSILENAHPLFSNCYQLILKMIKTLKYVDIESKDHPVVAFQSGLFECMSKLIRAGYDDIDFKLEAERGLILAALKRARKSLFTSLLTIPKLEEIKIISRTTLNIFRNEINPLLKEINQEILHYKHEH